MNAESLIDYDRYKTAQAALDAAFRAQRTNDFYQYSQDWAGIVATREGVTDLSDLLVALSEHSTVTEGMNWNLRDSERGLFLDYYRTYLTPELLRKHPMSWLGAPAVLDYDGLPASATHLKQLHLYTELIEMLRVAKAVDRGLNVVDIGAGFGGLGYLMLRAGVAKSFTAVDLPENLKISTFYLTQNFKDMPYTVIDSPQPVAGGPPPGVTFVPAGNLEALADWKFDLVINTDSLGEMPARTAQAYIRWIREHLVDGGLFFSKNGHSRGPDGVQYPHEYGYQQFQLVDLHPVTVISGLVDDFSHYALLRQTSTGQVGFGYDDATFDAICALYAVGLQGEVEEISRAFTHRTLTDEQRKFLATVDRFFTTQGLGEKLNLLRALQGGPYENVRLYLSGLVKYVQGNIGDAIADMKRYLPMTESYIAEAYAIMVLSRRDQSVLSQEYKFGPRTSFTLIELRKFYSYPMLLRELALRLRVDILRKKINYPANYSPSGLIRLKNIVLNVREGMGWSTARSVKGALAT